MLCNKGTWMQILVHLPFVDSYVYENRDPQIHTCYGSTYI